MGSSQAFDQFREVTWKYVYDVPFTNYPVRYYLYVKRGEWCWTLEIDGETEYGEDGFSCAADAAEAAKEDRESHDDGW